MASMWMLVVFFVLRMKQWSIYFLVAAEQEKCGKAFFLGLVIAGSPPLGLMKVCGSPLKQGRKVGEDASLKLPLQKQSMLFRECVMT